MTMNRRDRHRHGKRNRSVEKIELTPTHTRVLRALMEATEGIQGDYFHEAQLARDLAMNAEDLHRYLHELSRWGLVEAP